MQNRPHVRLETRVQHVLSSPIAPVGVVPWKPLVCAFVQPSIRCHTQKKRREREERRKRREPSIGVSKSRCIKEREEKRELYEALHESRSFQSAWVEFSAILLCVYLTIRTLEGFGKIVFRAWKKLWRSEHSSMDSYMVVACVWIGKQADFSSESGVVGWARSTISILLCTYTVDLTWLWVKLRCHGMWLVDRVSSWTRLKVDEMMRLNKWRNFLFFFL